MKSYQKKMAISLLSLMVVGSTMNLIITNANSGDGSAKSTANFEASVVEPKILTIDESKTSYNAKEDSPTIAESTHSEASGVNSPNSHPENAWTRQDADRLKKTGLTIDEIDHIRQLATSLNEKPDDVMKKMKEKNKDWDQVKLALLQEKKFALPEALEKKYENELKQIDDLQVSKKQRLQMITLLELKPSAKLDDVTNSFRKNGSEWLDAQYDQVLKDQTFDRSKLSKYGMTDEDIQGISPATLNQLEKLAEKTKRPFKELVTEIQAVQQNRK